MALPKVEVPTYELEIPSTDEKLKYRPFLVKEEKILLMALESQDNTEMMTALKEIVKACTYEKFDTDKAPLFDLEYIFLRLRAKSVGEISKIKLKCEDGTSWAEVEIPLEEVNVHVDEDHTNTINISDKIKVVMDYPKLDVNFAGLNDVEKFFGLIKACIFQITDGEEVYERSNMNDSELDEFIESLSPGSMADFKKFFESMPRLKYEVEYENPKTKIKEKRTLTGMNSFF
jgi:hypothetical protein|tara:strand:- start:234 stop:926 length:693 start_codon:yes stop_codon:yes gene_type:complete